MDSTPSQMAGQTTALDVVVVRMEPYAAEAVSALFRLVLKGLPYYNDRAKRGELSKYNAERLNASVLNDPDSVLIAKSGDQALGFCLNNYDDDLIWLAWFGVHPMHRRRGVASLLLCKLEETARRRNCHKIWCDSRTENLPSRSILTLQGYHEICTVTSHWYGQDFILWEKSLS